MFRTPWISSQVYATDQRVDCDYSCPRFAATAVLGPKLAKFTHDYPDVILDITADDSRMDIVAGGFDAGIHFGEYIQKT
jgi:DNA-binding transcriptional LysR family regulator